MKRNKELIIERHSINYKNKSKYSEATQEVIDYILSFDYGVTLPFDNLCQMFGLSYDDELERFKFKNIMAKVKNYLIEKGYILKTVAGVGYYILKPQHISGFVYHSYICKVDRTLEKSERILQHIDRTKLSEIRKREREQVALLNSELRNNISSQIFNSEYYENKGKYDQLDDN